VFKTLIEIVRKGNNFFTTYVQGKDDKGKKRSFGEFIEKKTREDLQFANSLRPYFTPESFIQVVNDFGLNFVTMGNCKPEELVVSYRIETPYSGAIDRFKTEDFKVLNNINNTTTGFFLNYNGHLEFTLSEMIRTNKVYIKPFIGDTYNFSPTNGNTYCQVYVSSDGKNWDYVTVLPSTYGSSTNDYVTEVNFNSLYSFQYIKFSSTGSALFSLSYLTFVKAQKPVDNKNKASKK